MGGNLPKNFGGFLLPYYFVLLFTGTREFFSQKCGDGRTDERTINKGQRPGSRDPVLMTITCTV